MGVTITDKKYSEKDSELMANAMENIKCREGVLDYVCYCCDIADNRKIDVSRGDRKLKP